MNAIEHVSLEGLRLDGRRPNEIRKIRFKMHLFSRADGSVYYEQGNTKVIAAVYGPREKSNKQTHQDRATIHCEYSMSTFSKGGEQKIMKKTDRRSAEISLVIKQMFESVIQTQLFPRTQIDIFMQVIQADGGTRCACINAATLALIDAGIPMSDLVVGCAAGMLDGYPLVDLNYIEDSAGGPDLPIAILPQSVFLNGNPVKKMFGEYHNRENNEKEDSKKKKIEDKEDLNDNLKNDVADHLDVDMTKVCLLQMDSKLKVDDFELVLKAGIEGCRQVYEYINKELKKHTLQLVQKRGVAT